MGQQVSKNGSQWEINPARKERSGRGSRWRTARHLVIADYSKDESRKVSKTRVNVRSTKDRLQEK